MRNRCLRLPLAVVLLLTLFLVSCQGSGSETSSRPGAAPPAPSTERPDVAAAGTGSAGTSPAISAADARALGRRASDQLARGLVRKLMLAVGQGSAHALDTCSLEGQATAESLSTSLGVVARRVAARYRNPADRPDPLEAAILEAFAAEPSIVDTLVWVEAADRSRSRAGPAPTQAGSVDATSPGYLYMRPIRINNPLCLTCHGRANELGPGVAEKVRELYPDDQAVDFAMGDLRGAFSILVPRERSGP